MRDLTEKLEKVESKFRQSEGLPMGLQAGSLECGDGMGEKKRRKRYGEKFKREVVERMRGRRNVMALGRELGLDIKMMYSWKWKEDERPTRKARKLTTKAAKGKDLETLRRENEHLKRVLAEKALELDFFRSALQQVEARRQEFAGSGGTPRPAGARKSSTASESG